MEIGDDRALSARRFLSVWQEDGHRKYTTKRN